MDARDCACQHGLRRNKYKEKAAKEQGANAYKEPLTLRYGDYRAKRSKQSAPNNSPTIHMAPNA